MAFEATGEWHLKQPERIKGMKVKNTAVYMGEDERRLRHNQDNEGKNKEKGKSIYAGDLNRQEDGIVKKRKDARKKAMKIVGDTFVAEKKIDAGQDARREKAAELTRDISKARKELSCMREGTPEELSAEEQAAHAKSIREYEKSIAKMENERQAENMAIRDTKIERLKKSPMLKAGAKAREIMEEASREIVGMLAEEAKDHIDEEMKEKEEQAEKAKEEKEEQEEKIEQAKEAKEPEKTETEELKKKTEELVAEQTKRDDFKKEIDEILDRMKLIEEDVKGAAVDTRL